MNTQLEQKATKSGASSFASLASVEPLPFEHRVLWKESMKTNLLTKNLTLELPSVPLPRWTAEQGRTSIGGVILPPMILPVFRSTAAWLLCGLLLCVALPSVHAQHRFTRLHSFGATNLAMFPPERLIEGSDGALYGTCPWPGPGAVVKLTKDGSNYIVLHSFPRVGGREPDPLALLEGRDGVLYGTTLFGGTSNQGTVFRLNTDGTGYNVLHNLNGHDGSSPRVLIEGRDGLLYGTAQFSGDGSGVVFKLNKDGTVFEVVHKLSPTGEEGSYPLSLLEGSDGLLYGTAANGGGAGYWGTIFRVNKNGGDFTVLHRLDRNAPEPAGPGSLLEGSDGVLYGTALRGGLYGVVFKLNKDGTGFATICDLPDCDTDGAPPLVEGPDGALYGLTDECGRATSGTAFKLNKDGTGYTLLHEFTNTNGDGGWVMAGPVMASDGAIYGTTLTGGNADQGTLFKLNPDGTGYQVLTSFLGNVPVNDGFWPTEGLVEGRDGALYGTSPWGGVSNLGTVFRIDKDGTDYSLLHSFRGGADEGSIPRAPLVEGSDGVLYGSTQFGGISNVGTVFKLNKDGNAHTVLWSFQQSDGAYPGRMFESLDGALYGTAGGGGGEDKGTVFKLNKDGTGREILWSFSGTNGQFPHTVMEGQDGALYGTAGSSLTPDDRWWCGLVFKLNRDGTGYTVLWSPACGTNTVCVQSPSELMEGSDGALYGTIYGDSSSSLFKINKDGTGFSMLHEFDLATDGWLVGPLVEGGDGLLYGTTEEVQPVPGFSEHGAVFQLGKDGSGFTALWKLHGADGEHPQGLMEGTDGALCGVTEDGGEFGAGTLFRLDVAPVLFNPVWRGNIFSFQFNARSNVVYQPQFRTSLAASNWAPLPSLTGQRGVVTVTDTNPPVAPRFYRVTVP